MSFETNRQDQAKSNRHWDSTNLEAADSAPAAAADDDEDNNSNCYDTAPKTLFKKKQVMISYLFKAFE